LVGKALLHGLRDEHLRRDEGALAKGLQKSFLVRQKALVVYNEQIVILAGFQALIQKDAKGLPTHFHQIRCIRRHHESPKLPCAVESQSGDSGPRTREIVSGISCKRQLFSIQVHPNMLKIRVVCPKKAAEVAGAWVKENPFQHHAVTADWGTRANWGTSMISSNGLREII
jgi:hypothetical protein